MLLAGGDDDVVRLVLLQHQVHGLDVVAGVAPVAERVEVAEVEVPFEPEQDARHRTPDLARDKGFAAHRALVVENDAVARVYAVGLAVVHGDPAGIGLGGAVGAARLASILHERSHNLF